MASRSSGPPYLFTSSSFTRAGIFKWTSSGVVAFFLADCDWSLSKAGRTDRYGNPAFSFFIICYCQSDFWVCILHWHILYLFSLPVNSAWNRFVNGEGVKTSVTGIPMIRSMAMEFEEDRNCSYLDKQYMLGDSLLAAPIFNESRCLPLPTGE